jgi:DNA replication protein DnaC
MSATPPTRYAAMGFDNWQPIDGGLDPRAALREWVFNREREWCVTLLGPTGTGKTHLATAVFGEWCSNRGFGWWLNASDALHLLREEQFNPPERKTPVQKMLLDPRLLLVDDFGTTKLTDFAHEKWLYVFGQRYNDCRPTIITSNAGTLEEFDAIDPRLTSRLHEGIVIRLDGQDHRSTAGAATTEAP